ncbi:hypothetical protein BKA66DRAFT_550948 [Pyrenochaeta sp. MPI-SDFR-AT-0127]|nr:hypothetical protein BKA66DRAFT_550948 [Pyrenochaeta sp. MPI-SDFR-AT-0127]
MRSFSFLFAAIAIPSLVSSLPTEFSTTNLPEPKFEGKTPWDEPQNVTDTPTYEERSAELHARQGGPTCSPILDTELVGDGAPLKWTYWAQISLPTYCNGGQCSAGVDSSKSMEFSFSADVHVNRWISGGFGVSKSYSTGVTNQCYSLPDKGHKKACIWSFKGHQTYTVKNIHYYSDVRCGPKIVGQPFRLTSPVGDNKVQGFLCGFDHDCHDQLGYTEWRANWYPN